MGVSFKILVCLGTEELFGPEKSLQQISLQKPLTLCIILSDSKTSILTALVTISPSVLCFPLISMSVSWEGSEPLVGEAPKFGGGGPFYSFAATDS